MINKLTSKKILASVFVFAVLAFSGAGYAEDTDIYLKPRSIPRDDAPNVLIIFDNSGSMEANVVQTAATPYDPTNDYSAGGTFDKDKIYFSTTGTPPTSSGTGNWVWAVDNHCDASKSNLDMVAGALGEWSGQIAAWKWEYNWRNGTSSTKGGWTNVNGNGGNNWRDGEKKIKDLDCPADSPIEGSDDYLLDGTNKNYTARYTNNSNQGKDTSGLSSPTLYSGNYLNYRSDPGSITYKTRMSVAQEVINNLIDTTDNVRFGLMTFNANYNPSSGHNAGRVVMAVDKMTAARKTAFKNVVNQMLGWWTPPSPVGSCDYVGPVPFEDLNCTPTMIRTPLAETLYEAYRYFGGLSVMYGDDAKATEVPVRDTGAEDGSGNYKTPFDFACQKAFIILITDGAPNNDDDVDTQIEALTGGSYGGDSDSDRLPDLAGYMANNDINLTQTGVQTAKIYTIGFATSQTLLQDAATQGQGEYFEATDSDTLKDSLKKAVSNIVNTTASFNAPTLSVNAFNSLFNRDEVYFSMFLPETVEAWPGNIKKYTLCNGTETGSGGFECYIGEIIDQNNDLVIDPTTLRIKGEVGDSTAAHSYWSQNRDGSTTTAGGAGENIPVPSSRKIYTYSGTYGTYKRIPQDTVDLSNTVNLVHPGTTITDLPPTLFGVSTKDERDSIIKWMLGDTSWTVITDPVGSTRDRWAFHDPLHSRPVAITYGAYKCTASDSCPVGDPNPDKPIIKLISPTNDGGIRFIDEATGVEEWVIVPQEMLEPLQAQLQNSAAGNHLYGIDGTPTFLTHDDNSDGVIDPNDGDYIYMYVGMRRGGSNIYAFDVTPALAMLGGSEEVKPELKWVIKGGTNPAAEISTDYDMLGQTWSRPLVADIQMQSGGGSLKRTVLIVGGGYDPDQDNTSGNTDDLGNAIFIINPLTGERIWWASNTGSGADLEVAGMDYSIPSDIAALDSDGDGARDRLYVGDVGGQLLRIDLSPTIKDGADGNPLTSFGYVHASLSGSTLQEKRKFFYRPNVAEVNDSNNSSTAKYNIITLASGDRSDPLDNQTVAKTPTPVDEIQNAIYAIRDTNIDAGKLASAPTALVVTDLYDATGDQLLDTTASNCSTNPLVNKKGWYINLIDQKGTPDYQAGTSDDEWAGEKSLARTVILDGWLYVTTYVPPSTTTAQLTCAASEGAGRLYAIPLLSGGYCAIGSAVDLGGGIPPELSVITREEGVTGLVGTNECLDLPNCCKRGDPRAVCCDRTVDPNCGVGRPPRQKTFWFEE